MSPSKRLDACYVELYERLGGAHVVEPAIAAFHTALISHPTLSPLFAGVDAARLGESLRGFFTMAFGGPNTYEGLDMRRAHAPARAAGLDDSHLEIARGLLKSAFAAQALTPPLLTEVDGYFQSMRDDILAR